MSFLREPASFTVLGRGDFPFDMLRKDRCWPDTTGDALALERPDSPTARAIRLTTDQAANITHDRWRSFGWVVADVTTSLDTYIPGEWQVRQVDNGYFWVLHGLRVVKTGFKNAAEATEFMNAEMLAFAEERLEVRSNER